VSESATTSRAADRKQATSSRLTALCRQLTAERGLNGFTIEEVCSEVGISRRTFFNYFPSKEDAVFGIDEGDEMIRFGEAFMARGSRGWGAVIDDLVESAAYYAVGMHADHHLVFMRVLEREPRLLARFIGIGRERDALLVALVAAREGVAADDPRARASVDVASLALRSVGERLSDPWVAENFGAALNDTIAALRAVLTTPSARKAQS
jgi:AcrR family transcriptional regulator